MDPSPQISGAGKQGPDQPPICPRCPPPHTQPPFLSGPGLAGLCCRRPEIFGSRWPWPQPPHRAGAGRNCQGRRWASGERTRRELRGSSACCPASLGRDSDGIESTPAADHGPIPLPSSTHPRTKGLEHGGLPSLGTSQHATGRWAAVGAVEVAFSARNGAAASSMRRDATKEDRGVLGQVGARLGPGWGGTGPGAGAIRDNQGSPGGATTRPRGFALGCFGGQ